MPNRVQATKSGNTVVADYTSDGDHSDHDEYEPVEAVAFGGFGVWNALSIAAGVCSLLLVLHQYSGNWMRKDQTAPVGGNVKSEIPRHDTPSPAPQIPGFKDIKVTSPLGGRLPKGGDLPNTEFNVLTWNIGPPSHNPFEFWMSSSNDAIAADIEPTLSSAMVSDVFTTDMYSQFKDTIAAVDRIPSCLEVFWATIKGMTIPAFLAYIEEKNHLQQIDPLTSLLVQKGDVHYRPSPVTCSDMNQTAVGPWWGAWKEFMFKTDITHDGRTGSLFGLFKSKTCTGVDVLSLAVYDAAMVHAFGKSRTDWSSARVSICKHIEDSSAKVLEVLSNKQKLPEIIFLQGVTKKVVDALRGDALGRVKYQVKIPARFDPDRPINTAVLLKNGGFLGITDLTSEIFPEASGSAIVLLTTRADKVGSKVVLSSFSGDPHQLETLHNYVVRSPTPYKMFVGCSSKLDDLLESDLHNLRKLNTVKSTPSHTVLYAKTMAQQRVSEAVKKADKTRGATKEVSDYIVYSPVDCTEQGATVDMDGKGSKETTMPTMEFPVLHGILTASLNLTGATADEMKASVAQLRNQLAPATPVPTEAAKPIIPEAGSQAPVPTAANQTANQTTAGPAETLAPEEVVITNTSEALQLPPAGTAHYINLPEGALYPKHAVESKEDITVTAVCDNGLGDRFGSLYSAVVLAHQLKAKFHIIWNVNNECRARLSVLLGFTGTSSSVANVSASDNLETKMYGRAADFDAILTLKHHFSTGHLVGGGPGSPTPPASNEQWLCGEARKIPLGVGSQVLSWAQDRQRKGLRTHILHHIDRLAQGLDLKMVGAALAYYNFKINPQIMARVNMFTERHKITPKNTVGVHLRGTDARIPLRMPDVITDVRLRFNTRTFFVCSDDKKAEQTFLSAFTGRAVSNTMKTHYPGKMDDTQDFRISGKLGAGRFNVDRGEASVVDALTDMAILSRTERPIIDGVLRDSSFGKMSTTLCVIRLSCEEELAKIAESVPAAARPG